jgi:aldose 1-epimerase
MERDMRAARPAPSGAQYRIHHGDQQATIAEVGAAVREYRVGARDVFHTYPEDEVSWAFHGTVLVPWPNRIADGSYEFDGETHQLGLSEPERRTALHGLAAWVPWTVCDHEPDRVTLEIRLLPSPGYPFHLGTRVEYSLGNDGLHVRATSTNTGDRDCPYAIGFHPYAAPAPGTTLDECTLQLGARRRLVPDERLLPIGEEDVTGGDYDYLSARNLSGRSLDDGFCDVVPASGAADGRSWVRLAGADGRTVAVWADSTFGFWQLYSADLLPNGRARRGLAVEPMTAAPNAFRSGRGLIRLRPGESVTTTWGAELL